MRNSEYMQRNPVRLDISRSKFHMTPRWTGTFKAYQLVPIFTYTDVLPGDTFKVSTSFVCRMPTPVAPVMDDLFLDVAFYFVPHELILSRSYMSPSTEDSNHSWLAFIGAQDSLLNMPVPDSDIELPSMKISTSSGYLTGGIADCMGMSQGAYVYKVNALAPLAFMAVWNENYREPNTQNPGVFSISSGVVSITWAACGFESSSSVWSAAALPNVCRFHGYFGSCLPWPQRNNTSVTMPLGTFAPVVTRDAAADTSSSTIGTRWTNIANGNLVYGPDNGSYGLGIGAGALNTSFLNGGDYGITSLDVKPRNLWADLANASAVSINTFRLAVQEQRWYEALARGGNRIDELTAALFGVMPKDAGQKQPEYLGGKRVPLQVSQVNVTANSSAGSSRQGVGDTGAFSLTADVDYYFTKSFDKWGSIIGVACVRYRDSFGQSINRMFTRHERFDFYFPQFANLGEQPVYKHELTASQVDNPGAGNSYYPTSGVFGYQEAWADYRYIPDTVSGLVRPGKSLAHWTYAQNFNTGYTLANFLADQTLGQAAVDKTLVVSSETSGLQFLAQFQFDITAVRPMPLYSIPGLVDHH